MLKQEGTCCEKKSEKKQESPAFKAGHNKVRRHLQKGENTMKRRDFMKLSAATALGATVAAMAPSALAATELDQTNGDLHTTVDRKTAAMGLGDGKTFVYDPENPYLNVNVGLFHDVQVTAGGQNVGAATYYLPDGMDPWAPAIIVLTPDKTTAKDFSGTVTGRMWRTVASKNKIGVAFFGPENGGSWNLSLSTTGRDDAAALDALYQLMRKKSVKLSGAFSMDKSHTALVGYKEGGAAALLFGARWASDFSSICAVDATEVPAASLGLTVETKFWYTQRAAQDQSLQLGTGVRTDVTSGNAGDKVTELGIILNQYSA